MADGPFHTFSSALSRRMRFIFADSGESRFGRDRTPRRKGLVITLCVLTSAVLWFMFSMQETYTQFFEFPTLLQNVPPEQALTELPPSTVRVQVEGQGVQLLRLYYKPPVITLDAANGTIDLTVAVAKVTPSVRMESVMPTQVILALEPRIMRRIPIRSRVVLSTESGYHKLGVHVLFPDSVTVSGGASILENLNYWPTQNRLLENVRSPIRVVVPLSDTLARLVDADVGSTEYQVDVQLFTEASRQVEIRVEDAPSGREITFVPASTLITFQVPLKQYSRALEATDFYVSVPFEEIRADTTGMVYPHVHLPEGLAIRESRISPDAFGYFFNLPERQ